MTTSKSERVWFLRFDLAAGEDRSLERAEVDSIATELLDWAESRNIELGGGYHQAADGESPRSYDQDLLRGTNSGGGGRRLEPSRWIFTFQVMHFDEAEVGHKLMKALWNQIRQVSQVRNLQLTGFFRSPLPGEI